MAEGVRRCGDRRRDLPRSARDCSHPAGARRGCTEAEIATITGHACGDVRSILEANYLHRDPALAESAIRKLEKGTKLSN